jgi:hypothetical protein
MSYQAALDQDTASPVAMTVDEAVTNLPAIVDADERAIAEGEAAAEKFGRSREQILPMARGLAAAKRKYPETQQFGDWLDGSAYSRLGKNDRAAVISIGEQLDEHEATIVKFLASTDLISPQTIWSELREKVEAPKKARPAPKVDPSYYDSKSAGDLDEAAPAATADTPAPDEKSTKPAESKPRPTNDGPKASRPHELYGTNKKFDLVVLTPSRDHLARARDANLAALGECLPLREHVGEAAAVVIAVKLTDLPVVIDRLLPTCGFKRPTRVLLLGQPKFADVVNARVLVTAERGDITFSAPEGWLDDTTDPVDLAEGLYEASDTLHLFAAAAAKDNQARLVIVGNDSWKKWPVL